MRQTFFDLEPKAYQQDMLDSLQAERDHGRRRSLVVAATGTGKTVVAAFDYRSLCFIDGGRPRLLFVAHREEILRQSMRTYREVLRDNTFGSLLAGGYEPESYDHLFATIDSVDARGLLDRFPESHWHTVVVDECHRLAADRFDRFVTRIRPRYLLGLTATPERSDGRSILGYFENRLTGPRPSSFVSGTLLTNSCCAPSNTSPAMTRQIFRRCRGHSRASLPQWTLWLQETTFVPDW